MWNGGSRDTLSKIIAGVVSALLLTALYNSGSWLLAVTEASRAVPGLTQQVSDHERRLREVETQRRVDEEWKVGVNKRLDDILAGVTKSNGRRR